MNTFIKVTYENNSKKINGRTLEEVLKDLKPGALYCDTLKTLFNTVNTHEEFMSALKEILEKETPPYVINMIMWIGGYTMVTAMELLEEIMQ